MPDDYLAAEKLIMAHWKTTMPQLLDVVSVPDLSLVRDVVKQSPSGVVMWDGDEVVTGAGGSVSEGEGQAVDQRWMLLVAIKNVRGLVSGSGARQEAGPLLMQTISTFAGWKPGEGYRPMRRMSGPRPGVFAGFAYFPVVFATRMFT